MQCLSLCSFLCPSAALGIVCTNAGIGSIGYAGSFFSVAALIICFFFLAASVPGENAEH
jgi:predicted membrane metal-binding protein